MSKNACTKCGGTYEKQEGERVCMQCGNRPDNKPFPDVVEKIAQDKSRGPYKRPVPRGSTLQSPVDLTEDERIAIVNEGKERGYTLVAGEREVTPNTIYNWRFNLKKYGCTRIKGLHYQQMRMSGIHPMIANLLQQLPPSNSKPSETLLDGFARAFGGILTIIYLKED